LNLLHVYFAYFNLVAKEALSYITITPCFLVETGVFNWRFQRWKVIVCTLCMMCFILVKELWIRY